MFKNNGINSRMESLDSIRARMAAYDQLPLLAVDAEKIQEAA